jgi:hypothetical protein
MTLILKGFVSIIVERMAQNVLQYSVNDIRSDAGMDEPRTQNVPLSSSERMFLFRVYIEARARSFSAC